MAIIAELAVNVVARTEALTKGLTKAKALTSQFSKNLGKLTSALSPLNLAIGGLSTAGVVAGLQSTASALDTVAKTSDRLGISAQNLVALRHAAELSGVASGSLDKAMQKLSVRMAQAATGTGEAVKTLQQLGLNAKQLVNLPLDKQLGMVADRMAAIPNAAHRAAIATKLFEEEGVALVNMLQNGSAGLRSMMAESKALTGSFTRESLARVEAFNDAMQRLRHVIGVQAQNIVITIAPAAEKAVNALAGFVGGLGVAGRGLSTTQGQLGFIQALGQEIGPMQLFRNAMSGRAPGDALRDYYLRYSGAQTRTEAVDRSTLMQPSTGIGPSMFSGSAGRVESINSRRALTAFERQVMLQQQMVSELKNQRQDQFSIP